MIKSIGYSYKVILKTFRQRILWGHCHSSINPYNCKFGLFIQDRINRLKALGAQMFQDLLFKYLLLKDGMEFSFLANLVYVGLGFGLLWWTGDLVVRYALQVAHAFRVTTFFIGFIVLALAAAIPELAVAITSALKGVSEVSAGDIIGANFIDVALVIGTTLVLAGQVLVGHRDSRKLVSMIGLSSLVLVVIFAVGTLTKVHGLVLIGIYLASTVWVWLSSRNDQLVDEELLAQELQEDFFLNSRWGKVTKLLGSFGLVLASSALTVHGAVEIAMSLALPLETIGATLMAIGTSLPEIVLCLSALRRKQYSLALAPTLGTVLEQTTLVLGVLSLLSKEPVKLAGLRGASIFMFLAFFVISYGLFRFSQVGRKTGFALVSLFFGYLAYQFTSGGML